MLIAERVMAKMSAALITIRNSPLPKHDDVIATREYYDAMMRKRNAI